MKSRIFSIILAMCLILTSISVPVFASDSGATVFSVVNDGVITPGSASAKNFFIVNAVDSAVKSDGLGGKKAGDNYVSMKTKDSGQTYVDIILNSADHDKKYIVYNYSIYGNSTKLAAIVRYSGSVQPRLATINTSSLFANKWNNIQFVYNTSTRDFYFILNGAKYNGNNLGDALKDKPYDSQYTEAKASLIPQFRLLFETKNVSLAYDDVSCYKSDTAPTAMTYGTITEADGFKNNSNIIVGADEPVSISSDYDYTVLKAGATEWTEETSVNVGDVIAVEYPYYAGTTEYYKTYKYITCVDPTIVKEVKDQSTFAFQQGGSPLDSEGVAVTNTRKDVENVYGSGMTMEFVGVGINNDTSKQSYYYTNWNKAKSYTERYLVFEADIAFAAASGNVLSGTYFNLSTNGGTGISIHITGVEYTARVNHYIWVYDVQRGIYSEYINGKTVTKDAKMDNKFASGSGTAIRFSINGNSNTSSEDKTILYGGYMENLRLYECNTAPVVKQPLKAPGQKLNTLPVPSSKISVADIKALFSEDDNVSVYSNRSFNAALSDNASVNAGAGMIVTEKDGIYDYIRVAYAPSEDADYAIETLQMPEDGSIIANVQNYGEERDVVAIIARYTASGDILDVNYTPKKVEQNGTVYVTAPATDSAYTASFFVWDSISGMVPVDEPISLK